MVYWYNSAIKPGRIELTTTPGDATVLIDNVKVGDHSPVSIEKSPGPYTLSVTRDGYARNDQNIELKAGQPLALTVTLEPSPDTGFELTSDPPGGLVWLDDAPVKERVGAAGAHELPRLAHRPGHHVLEIRGENRFKPWRQDVEIEPGDIRKIHATLIPAVGGPAAAAASAAPLGTAPPAGGGARAPMAAAADAGVADARRPSSSSRSRGKAPAGSRPTPPAGGDTAPSRPAAGPRRRRRAEARAPREAPPRDEPAGGEADAGEDAPAPRKTVAPRTIRAAAAPTARSRSTRSRGPRSGSTARTRRKHTPIVDYKVPCGKHKLAFKRPDMQIDQTESINVQPGPELQAALHAGHRGLSRTHRRGPASGIQSQVSVGAASRRGAGAAAGRARRGLARLTSRARARRRAHPSARDFLHRDLKEAFARIIPADASVLEVGCGEGDLLAALPNARRMGIDYLPETIERARARHPDISFEVGDVTAAAAPRIGSTAAGTWDAVICDRLATACSTSRRCSLGLKRQLAPGGRIYMTAFNYMWELPDAAGGDDRLEASGADRRTGCPTPTTATCSTSSAWRSCATRTACCCRWRCRALSDGAQPLPGARAGDAVRVAVPDLRAARSRRACRRRGARASA